MNIHPDHIDYGIYIDNKKAYIVLLNEFDKHLQATVQVAQNLHPGETVEIHKSGMQPFCQGVIAQLKQAHRLVIFGPSEAKYELHKALQKEKKMEGVLKELLVTDHIESEDIAIRFTEKYFTSRLSF